MATERLPMRTIREILRQKWQLEYAEWKHDPRARIPPARPLHRHGGRSLGRPPPLASRSPAPSLPRPPLGRPFRGKVLAALQRGLAPGEVSSPDPVATRRTLGALHQTPWLGREDRLGRAHGLLPHLAPAYWTKTLEDEDTLQRLLRRHGAGSAPSRRPIAHDSSAVSDAVHRTHAVDRLPVSDASGREPPSLARPFERKHCNGAHRADMQATGGIAHDGRPAGRRGPCDVLFLAFGRASASGEGPTPFLIAGRVYPLLVAVR
jgi:hypothetical protein